MGSILSRKEPSEKPGAIHLDESANVAAIWRFPRRFWCRYDLDVFLA
jgi:hypothetical protein